MRTNTLVHAILASALALTGCGATEDEPLGTESLELCPVGEICAPPTPRDPPPPPPTVGEIAARYTNFDLNGDGIREINWLRVASWEPARCSGASPNGMVIVLVDPRLYVDKAGRWIEMASRIVRYRDDLVADGYCPRFVEADVYKGAVHQDGRTLLALRRFLKDVRASYLSLRGVVLVGSFPEAALIRRPLVRLDNRDVELQHGGKKTGVNILDMHPERINARGEIVLGDLDGKWETLYRQAPEDLPWLTLMPQTSASWPVSGQTLTTTVFSSQVARWEDFFYINDAQVTKLSETATTISVRIDSSAQANAELTTSDKAQPNPIARPELTVSRINAKGIALSPSVPRADRDGRLPLAADGKPQPLIYDSDVTLSLDYDFAVEQRILMDYFDRNHAFRTGSNRGKAYRTSAVRARNSDLETPSAFNSFLRAMDSTLGTGYGKDDASLYDYASFLKQPAIVRGIAAHSSSTTSQFGEPFGQDLDQMIGGRPWAWKKQVVNGYTWLIPTWEAFGAGPDHHEQPGRNADYGFYRTLFENHALDAGGQAFYVHGGCDVTLPWGSADRSFDDDGYSRKNNAEMTLFFANGLAIIGRGKVFNDLPDGYPEGVNAADRFGYGWRQMFVHDAADDSLDPGTTAAKTRTLNTKKAYYWGLLGDFTLRMKY